jgi:hypothetical protein
MSSLSTTLRNQLRSVTLDARQAAEKACRASLENLAVHEGDYRPHMSMEQRQLRNRLRARGRALGDERDRKTNAQSIQHITEDAAYEQWHRLLFTRFLAENGLLVTDEENGNVEVTLADCEELASELGARDGFDLACRFASETLPGVFRTGDPILELPLAANNQVELRRLLDSIPAEVFTTDDALGWTYQFWQEERKKEVNESGEKIGADELSPVTQLFTEDYMVEFLLHNTLGAWWAGRCAEGPSETFQVPSEEEARAAAALPPKDGLPGIDWTYLRFVQDEETQTWSPAAGTFEGWPTEAKDITFLDPCMGSGHFPVFALPILARLRMEEENLSTAEAVHAVLRDNIHGLELDPRCCQIGAFNLALTAWKLGGYQALPPLHVACCGLAPQAKKEDWLKLAGDSDKLRRGMEKLYDLFKQAPVLGSLINPRLGGGDLLEAGFGELQPLLEQAMEDEGADEATHELAVTAQGIAKAAELLTGRFTLVATNVPYLGRPKQDDELMKYCERMHFEARADLATCFVERCLTYCTSGGSSALVTPQNWLFQPRYQKLRETLLDGTSWDVVVRLGPNGFITPMWDFNTMLLCLRKLAPNTNQSFTGIDVQKCNGPLEKMEGVRTSPTILVDQRQQSDNPKFRVVFGEATGTKYLSDFANAWQGIAPTDADRFRRNYWEMPIEQEGWKFFQSSCSGGPAFAGRELMLFWEDGHGEMEEICQPQGTFRGKEAWGKSGVSISKMSNLPASLYTGELFDPNAHALVPFSDEYVLPVWTFCSSEDFVRAVRDVDQKVDVNNSTMGDIPFDLEHWQKVAAEKYPDGLPKPHSDDPTQWLFNGHPKGSEQPLHVAVARLLGYRWPRQTGSSFPDCPAIEEDDGLEKFADEDGIVCLAALNRELPAAARLRTLLATALGTYDERALIKATGSKKTNLEDWLRDDFFKGHCALFHKRPFLWHLWDGLPDGFHVLVNYHQLDEATLKTLAYTYLGDWIREQKAAAEGDTPGAAERLGAATALQEKLVAILEGEAPLDLFVRWKPIKDQAIGWNPDLNDGVRLNIRPFLLAGDVKLKGAGLFRVKPGIEFKPKPDRGKEPQRDQSDYPWFWCDKDPGTDPEGDAEFTGKRWNTVHLSLANKRAAQ